MPRDDEQAVAGDEKAAPALTSTSAPPRDPSVGDASPSTSDEQAAPQRPTQQPLHHDDASQSRTAEPPPLPYTLRTRKRSIALFWSIFFVDTNVQPLVLYYTLWYLTDMSDNLVFTITTITLGGVSVAEYFYRFWQLFKKGSQVRPLNARRSWLDFFQINFTLVWFLLAVELIVGTVREHPPIRLLAMPLPTVLFYFGFVFLSLDVLRAYGFRAPFRISSTPKGAVMPTALYPLIEDIVAVDGGGGQRYRHALRSRYLASPPFRQMLFEMNCFWAGGAVAAATLTTALVFTLPRDAAYACGWSVPFVWAAIWTAATVPRVQWHLRRERRAWARLTAHNREVLGSQPYEDVVRTRFRNEPMPVSVELDRGVTVQESMDARPATNPKRTSAMRRLLDIVSWPMNEGQSQHSRPTEKEMDLERGVFSVEDVGVAATSRTPPAEAAADTHDTVLTTTQPS
ncbi:hypothetical protein KEM52_006030 [Ascosphaera acerosa]|nr:hypothetical protein KEM52_006030 [Ascosphaera acerosa]